MRLSHLFLLALVFFCAGAAFGAEGDPEIFFAESTDQQIRLRRFAAPLDATANECPAAGICRDLYSIEYVGTEAAASSVATPDVTRAHVDPNTDVLELDLSGPIMLSQAGATLPLSSFRLVLRQIRFQGNGNPNRSELALAPTFFLDFDDSRESLIYRGLRFRRRPVGQVTVTLRDPVTGGTIVYDNPEVNPYPSPDPDGNLLWHLKLDPTPPRGKLFQVSVTGVDDFQGSAITRSEAVTFAPFPKGREDATFYLKGQKVYNQKGEDQGSIDFKNERVVFSPARGQEWWYLVSATVGSKKLNLSQTGTVLVGYRRWLDVNPREFSQIAEWAVTIAPKFQTDRDFENRDLGMDLMLTGEPAPLFHPIELRRRTAADMQEAARIATGWWVKPKFAIEAGEHLASSSGQVEGKAFTRVLAAMNLMWETDRAALSDRSASLKLTVDVVARYLTEDEVTIDQDNVLKIEDGYKPYLRAELAYDFGFAGLSVVHENGKIPPAFKTARATTVGVTFKF